MNKKASDIISLELSTGWWGDIYAWKYGDIITVTTGSTFFAKNATSGTVATLPEGYRPAHEIYGADNADGWTIQPDGRVGMDPGLDRVRRRLAISFAAAEPEPEVEEKPEPKKRGRPPVKKDDEKGEPDEE